MNLLKKMILLSSAVVSISTITDCSPQTAAMEVYGKFDDLYAREMTFWDHVKKQDFSTPIDAFEQKFAEAFVFDEALYKKLSPTEHQIEATPENMIGYMKKIYRCTDEAKKKSVCAFYRTHKAELIEGLTYIQTGLRGMLADLATLQKACAPLTFDTKETKDQIMLVLTASDEQWSAVLASINVIAFKCAFVESMN